MLHDMWKKTSGVSAGEIVKRLSKIKLDIVGLQEIKWGKSCTEQQVITRSRMEIWMRIFSYAFLYKRKKYQLLRLRSF
jgi:hypothetical protein